MNQLTMAYNKKVKFINKSNFCENRLLCYISAMETKDMSMTDVNNDLLSFENEDIDFMDAVFSETIFDLNCDLFETSLQPQEENELLNIYSGGQPLWTFRPSGDADQVGSATIAELEVVDRDQSTTTENSLTLNRNDTRDMKAPTFVEMSNSDKVTFIDSMKNKNTVRKTKSVMKTFNAFVSRTIGKSESDVEIEKMGPTELDSLIGTFLLSIRKSDGDEYEPDTLTAYHRGIDRYLREKNYNFSLINDREFKPSRDALEGKRKDLKQKGKGLKPNRAEPITMAEENMLYEKKIIGTHDPQALLNLMWLNNTKLFGMRGVKENHNLMWGDIILKKDEQNREYLEFFERATKTRTGSTTDLRPFCPKAFAIPENPDRCPVFAFKQYEFRRPSKTKIPGFPFYVTICHNRKPNSEIWYKAQPLGDHTLETLMKKMAQTAQIPGRKTNTSARKTTCTRLLHSGVAASTIKQLTGHKNIASVENYAVASKDMQHEMSNILCGINPNTNISNRTPHSSSTCSAVPVSTFRPASSTCSLSTGNDSSFYSQMNQVNENVSSSKHTSHFEGHHFHIAGNCKIQYINNYVEKSPPKKRSRLLIYSDSDSD